jgi:hypothetical protein
MIVRLRGAGRLDTVRRVPFSTIDWLPPDASPAEAASSYLGSKVAFLAAPSSTRQRMTNDLLASAVRGKTMRWSFTTGPTTGKTYEHVFTEDGTVTFTDVAEKKTASTAATTPAKSPPKYAAVDVVDGVELVSYLSNEGYTLSVVLNFRDHSLVGVASGNGQWHVVGGTFEVMD